MKSKNILNVILLVFMVVSCVSKSVDLNKVSFVHGLQGPEDLVLDTSVRPARILVSSDSRRDSAQGGRIYAVDPKNLAITLLPRKKDPLQVLHPHGISIIKLKNGQTRLYVVNHQGSGKQISHSIRVYRVLPHKLLFVKSFESPLLTSPNDICALPNGSFYVANDRSKNGGFIELFFALPKSTVVFCDGEDHWKIAAKHFAMANSIQIQGKFAYVSETRGNCINRFEILPDACLSNRTLIARIPGADNLTLQGDLLLVASHADVLAFMRHASNSKNLSPSAIYTINLKTKTKTIIFHDTGTHISAASGAIIFDHRLWIGQVFEDFIMVYPLDRKEIFE